MFDYNVKRRKTLYRIGISRFLRSSKLLNRNICSWRGHRSQRAKPSSRGDQLAAEADAEADDVAEIERVIAGVVETLGLAVVVTAIVEEV